MKNIVTLFMVLICLNINGINAQNAPVSTIGAFAGYNATATVSITATGLNDIGSCNLRLVYDPSIAICTSVTKGPLLVGGLASNILTPGVITIGWYTWPGVSLPDNSVTFNLSFDRVGFGSTGISWDETYPDRQWSNGSFQIMNDLPLDDYYIDGSLAFLTNNAPQTIAPDVIGIPGNTVSIPVTVNNFNNIGSLALTTQFDDVVLSFQSFTNNSGFPGLFVSETSPGVINTTGLVPGGSTGFNLADNAVLFTLNFLYFSGTSTLTWFDNGTSCQYAGYPAYNVLTDSPTAIYYINGSVSEGVRLGLTVFLEGAFDGPEMATTLNNSNLIPFTQPYSGSPWDYAGTETVATIPTNTVDWVLVELRETPGGAGTATPDKMIAQRAAFLLKDGSIKDIDGTTDLEFSLSITDNLFIVVSHRMHLSIISANPTTFVGGVGNYNFSLGESQALGGTDGHKELSPGIWGMMAGDSNADGIIDGSDKMDYWKPNAGTKGYLPSDFSMDAEIKNQDKNDFWYMNYGSESQVPE